MTIKFLLCKTNKKKKRQLLGSISFKGKGKILENQEEKLGKISAMKINEGEV